MERQAWGFIYQKVFCQKNNLVENKNYTDKFDTKINNYNCQIKTYKERGELMMADPFRYLSNKEDFVLVVANRDGNNNIISERKILIKNDKFQSFLKEQNFESRANYCQAVLSSVSNDHSDDERFKELMKKEKRSRKGSIINMQAKRDHKRQKRVQWAIPNRYIDTFLNLFEEI